jgi:hypothetical protein
MKRSRRLIALLSALLVGVLSGCKQEAPPGTIAGVRQDGSGIDVGVSVAPNDGGLLITAVASNQGNGTFRYTATCGRADMTFQFFDEAGNEVQVTNPCEPQPMMGCPTALGLLLAPGQTATGQHWWSGSLWSGCVGSTAPAGTYTVKVSFPFYQDIDTGRDEAEGTGTFHWGE